MKGVVRGFGLATVLAVVSAFIAVPPSNAQSTAAHVYVQIQGPAGAVYEYNASPSGQLSAIPGSPFKPGTLIIGGTNAQFYTLGKTSIHSYAVQSNGAIGSELSTMSILNNAGSACGGGTGGIDDAVLDHSGKYMYVLLQNGGDGSCAAYQSYAINSNGSFSFDGDTEENTSGGAGVGVPSILGNESFGYATEWIGHYSGDIGFRRESSGTLQLMQFHETDPTLTGTNYLPAYPDASPSSNYVVMQLYPNSGGGDSGNPQLASYSVDAQGNLTTTNTSSNMPTPALLGAYSTFSPDGSMFVLYAGGSGYGSGIEIYNFNGPAPLTLKTRLLTGTPIDEVQWDTSNHMYAISTHTNTLYVYTVTSAGAVQNAALPIGSPFSMVVVSQAATTTGGGGACTAPTSNGVNVCSPGNGATAPSPVQINASATVSGGVYRFELWNGSTKLASVDSGVMDQTVTLKPGSYTLTFDAYNSSKTIHEYAKRNITVQ